MNKNNKKFKETEIGFIPEEWKLDSLGECSLLSGGKRLSKEDSLVEYKTHHPYIRITDFSEYGVDEKRVKFITEEVHNKIKKYVIEEGDIYISNVGTIGLVGVIKKNLSGANLTENAVRITKLNGINNYFLYYYLKSSIGQEQIKQNTVGAVQPKLPIYGISNIKILLPDISEQKQIAEILSSLDDKIELNRKINSNLEKIASLLFKQWFVDFEFPNEDGEPYKSSGGKMISSEIGKIPEIFEIKKAISLLEFIKGIEPGSKSYSNEFDDDKVYFYRVADMFNGVKSNTFIEKIDSKNVFCNYDDVLISTDGTVGRVVVGIKGSYSGGIRKVVGLDESITNEFIYFWLKSQYVQNMLEEYAANATTIAHASGALKDLTIPYNAKILKDFGNIIEPTFKLMQQNLKQNNDLSDLRDSLLPRLMSGKIRVSKKYE